MSRVVSVCAIALFIAACQATDIIKGLYCQDPDTGKLYPVNSTWPSETFCGNYTCKIRKKNVTETQYSPVQKIDISKFKIELSKDKDNQNDMPMSPSQNSLVYAEKTDSDKQPIYHKGFLKTKDKEPTTNDLNLTKDLKDTDRFLTEGEIKAITDMLQSVKKSDLEAIVDIYNLAQDIYKEIDNVNTDKLVKETIDAKKLESLEKNNDNKQSYWYEPFSSKHLDLSHEGTNTITTKKQAHDSYPNFFQGPLTDEDFGKLTYYYPISNFQRESSYMHPTQNDLEKPPVAPIEKKPCKKPQNSPKYVAIPWYGASIQQSQPPVTVRPSTLLPYPFSYIYHYNVSSPINYYYNHPWAYANYNRQRNYPQPYYGAYIAQVPSYAYDKPVKEIDEASKLKHIERELSKNTINVNSPKEKLLPDWQTEPLSEKVIEEVRAHIEKPKSFMSIPLKRNVKLERVGKVIKLDELTRKRRQVVQNNIEAEVNESYEFEAYVEKTTCDDRLEVGYFAMGNMSQPFPRCCPQKLESIHTKRDLINIQ